MMPNFRFKYVLSHLHWNSQQRVGPFEEFQSDQHIQQRMQLSSICEQRNRDIIPSLLSAHHAVLHGDGTVVDMSTAENWSTKEKLVPKVRESLANLSEEVSVHHLASPNPVHHGSPIHYCSFCGV